MAVTTSSIDFYSLFCGVILFEEDQHLTLDQVLPWVFRLKQAPIFLNHLNRNYYHNFLFNIAPEALNANDIKHYTFPDIYNAPPVLSWQDAQGNSIEVVLSYFDFFVFPEGVGVFSFKIKPLSGLISYQTISKVINHLRNPSSIISYQGVSSSVSGLIKNRLSLSLCLTHDWDKFIPQLKTYTNLNDLSTNIIDDELNYYLFALSHVLPFELSQNSGKLVSEEYFKSVMNTSLNIYNNWRAISLFDTFTRISCSFQDTYTSWEHEYFLIYIHSIYTKFQLYSFNSKLKDVNVINTQTTEIRNRFIEFVNDYHLAYISYKFLPNLLYEKMNGALEIQKELDRMEVKIERIHEMFQEKKSNQMNRLLLIISLLSILSVITDLSQWLIQMGIPENFVYSPSVPLFIIGTISLFGLWLFKKVK